jgi:beta-lactamase regulating signal transducer with metallopeptidase domain
MMNLPESVMTLLTAIASWAWDTSLIILLPAVVVLALGRWQGFPARWRGWLAAIVLIRLLLPWVPEVSWRPSWAAPLHVVQSTAAPVEARSVPADVRQTREAAPYVPSEAGHAAAAVNTATVTGASSQFAMPSLATIRVWLWLAGVAAVGSWIVYSHVVLHRLITRCRTHTDVALHRDLEWCADRMGVTRACALWMVRGLPTVAVHGWVKPAILVPDSLRERFSTEEIRGMFLHELAHVRRGDLFWSRVMLVVCALHWFNPLVWLLARRMRADAELECDRIAIEKLSHTQRCHYGEALLKTLEFSPACVPAPALPFFRHAKEIQTRIQMIALPRSSAVARYAAFVIAPALACLTLTAASADGDEKQPKAGEEKAKSDGEQTKSGPRDGEQTKSGARDGEAKKEGPRDGEEKKTGPRDGEQKKTGARDGEGKKEGSRDGEGKKTGMRDGEARKSGPRDGETKKSGARDGEGSKKGSREGDTAVKATSGEAVALRLVDKGENVSIGGKTFPLGKLRGYFSQQAAGMALTVQADPDVPYKAVSEVLDAARDNGITNVALATAGEDGGGKKKPSKEG